MTYCNWSLLFALLQEFISWVLFQFTTFVCTVVYYNFWLHSCKLQIVCNGGICNFFKCYDKCLFMLALLQLSTFVSTIAINNCCMPYFNSQLLCTPLLLKAFICAIVNSKFFIHYYNSRQLLYVLLELKMLSQQYCSRQQI